MDTGTALVIVGLGLCIVLLYGITKDRWNWRKVVGGGVATVLLLSLAGALVVRTLQHRSARMREQAAREEHEIEVGDHYRTVLQRHGPPDQLMPDSGRLRVVYSDGPFGGTTAYRLFELGADSIVRFIYLGPTESPKADDWRPRGDFYWPPSDAVDWGMTRAELLEAMGSPCDSDLVGERYTRYWFEIGGSESLRFVDVTNGRSRVQGHGWSDRTEC